MQHKADKAGLNLQQIYFESIYPNLPDARAFQMITYRIAS